MRDILIRISTYLGWYAYRHILLTQRNEIKELKARISWLDYNRKYTLQEEIDHLRSVLRTRANFTGKIHE